MGKVKFEDKKIKELQNSWKIIILGILFIFGGFLYYQNTQEEISPALIDPEKVSEINDLLIDRSDVYVMDKNVQFGVVNFVESKDLKPSFRIEFKNKPKKIIVDGIDVLNDSFFIDPESIKIDKKTINFSLPFLVKPGNHEIIILEDDDNTLKYKFVLSLLNTFDQSINESEFLLLPESTKQRYEKSWYVSDGVLCVDPLKGEEHASLAFLYPYTDVDVSFEFKPKGSQVSLLFYFLESSRSLVIGNGNNKRITFLRGNDGAVEGEDFEMLPNKIYSARVMRSDKTYKLFLKEGLLTTINFTEDDLMLSFDDVEGGDKEDSLGLTVWSNTDGIEIDNLIIFPKEI